MDKVKVPSQLFIKQTPQYLIILLFSAITFKGGSHMSSDPYVGVNPTGPTEMENQRTNTER